jgi:hypothetical protein
MGDDAMLMLEPMVTDLTPGLRTAGFALAHALGSIQFGGTLCTMAAVVQSDGQRALYRYPAPTISESLTNAHEHLSGQIDHGARGALVYDGFVTTPDGKRSDALVVEMLGPGAARQGRFAQAYRPARRLGLPIVGRRIAVLGAPIIDEALEHPDPETAIIDGAQDHPFGGRLLKRSIT